MKKTKKTRSTHDLTDLVLKYLEACELYDTGEDPEGDLKYEMQSEIMSAHVDIPERDWISVTLEGEEERAIVIQERWSDDLWNFVISGGEKMDIFEWIDSIVPAKKQTIV